MGFDQPSVRPGIQNGRLDDSQSAQLHTSQTGTIHRTADYRAGNGFLLFQSQK